LSGGHGRGQFEEGRNFLEEQLTGDVNKKTTLGLCPIPGVLQYQLLTFALGTVASVSSSSFPPAKKTLCLSAICFIESKTTLQCCF